MDATFQAKVFNAATDTLTNLVAAGFPLASWAVIDTGGAHPTVLKAHDEWADFYREAVQY